MKFPLRVYIQCLQLRTDTCVYLLSDNSTQSTVGLQTMCYTIWLIHFQERMREYLFNYTSNALFWT